MGIIRKYGFFGVITMGINLIRTKLLFNNARIIRFPIDIRGKKFLSIKKGLTTGISCRIEAFSASGNDNKTLSIGENVQLNDFVHITAGQSVVIGNNVLIASKVYISDTSHGEYKSEQPSSPYQNPSERKLITQSVVIEDNVWIGEGVCVLPGVTIGFGSIIGSNAVVSKSIPPMSIAVGIPAIVIKHFNEQNQNWVTK